MPRLFRLVVRFLTSGERSKDFHRADCSLKSRLVQEFEDYFFKFEISMREFCFPAAGGTIADFVPASFPLFAPLEGAPAVFANFMRRH